MCVHMGIPRPDLFEIEAKWRQFQGPEGLAVEHDVQLRDECLVAIERVIRCFSDAPSDARKDVPSPTHAERVAVVIPRERMKAASSPTSTVPIPCRRTHLRTPA